VRVAKVTVIEKVHAVRVAKVTVIEKVHAVRVAKVTVIEKVHAVRVAKVTVIEKVHAVRVAKVTVIEKDNKVLGAGASEIGSAVASRGGVSRMSHEEHPVGSGGEIVPRVLRAAPLMALPVAVAVAVARVAVGRRRVRAGHASRMEKAAVSRAPATEVHRVTRVPARAVRNVVVARTPKAPDETIEGPDEIRRLANEVGRGVFRARL
jgi:hypothetical protein